MPEASLLDSNTNLNAAKFTWRGQFSADQVPLTFGEGGSKLNKAENILLSAEDAERRGERQHLFDPQRNTENGEIFSDPRWGAVFWRGHLQGASRSAD